MSKRNELRGSTAVKFALGVVGGLLAATPAAWAQAVEAVQDEIVVTATKHGDVFRRMCRSRSPPSAPRSWKR